MSEAFRTVVNSNVDRDARLAAIERLVERGEKTNLRVLVQTAGLRGTFRRQALEGLVETNARAELQLLAEDRALESSLRKEAQRAV